MGAKVAIFANYFNLGVWNDGSETQETQPPGLQNKLRILGFGCFQK